MLPRTEPAALFFNALSHAASAALGPNAMEPARNPLKGNSWNCLLFEDEYLYSFHIWVFPAIDGIRI
jgi:hypothetical protein